jgi:hypothetical protein
MFTTNDALIYKMKLISSRRCSWFLTLSSAGYLVNSMEVTMEMLLFLFLVPGRSQVIALRGSYNDGCRRKQFRSYLAETWSKLSTHRVVHMTVHIHVAKEKGTKSEPFGKKGAFADT